MVRLRALAIAFVLGFLAAACGGSGSSNSGSGGSSSGGSGTGTTPINPCTNALTDDAAEVAAVGAVAQGTTAPADKRTLVDGDPRGRLAEALALNRQAEEYRRTLQIRRTVEDASRDRPEASAASAPVAQDIGEIAVLQDTGDLVLPLNLYDLKGTGLRFSRSGGSYSVSKIDGTFRAALGNRVTLGDDDSAAVAIPFAFPYYGNAQTSAFINSDGNITLGEGDNASSDRSLARMLSGAPRISPFFADLDPTSGGKIFVNAAADQYTVTWCSVRGFDSTHTTTAQATLLPDGSVELKFDSSINLTDAVVGISPGHTGDVTLVDFSTGSGSGSGAIAERFAATASIDTFAAAQKFYQTHPDNYDQVLLWTDQRLVTGGSFAYEINIANEVKGIGQDIFDLSTSVGSAGRLRSLVNMDWLGKYPADPTAKFLGENDTLSVLGQECGHRWLAYVHFRDHTGANSAALLGRDEAHWSFFFNSDASVMEGNQIEDLEGGSFKTVDAVKRYSRLDQYIMGAVPPSQVPTFFYVENPNSTHAAADAPQVGVSFTGTRRDVLVDDVIAVNGPRVPSSAAAPKVFRPAFVYIVSNGRSLDQSQVTKLDGIRTQWETFFAQATESHMTSVTRLR